MVSNLGVLIYEYIPNHRHIEVPRLQRPLCFYPYMVYFLHCKKVMAAAEISLVCAGSVDLQVI